MPNTPKNDDSEEFFIADYFTQFNKILYHAKLLSKHLNGIPREISNFLQTDWKDRNNLNTLSFEAKIEEILTFRSGAHPSENTLSAVKEACEFVRRFVSNGLAQKLTKAIEPMLLVGGESEKTRPVLWADPSNLINEILHQVPAKFSEQDIIGYLLVRIETALDLLRTGHKLIKTYWQETVSENLVSVVMRDKGLETRTRESVSLRLDQWLDQESQTLLQRCIERIDWKPQVGDQLSSCVDSVLEIQKATQKEVRHFNSSVIGAVNKNFPDILFLQWKYGDEKSFSIRIKSVIALLLVCSFGLTLGLGYMVIGIGENFQAGLNWDEARFKVLEDKMADTENKLTNLEKLTHGVDTSFQKLLENTEKKLDESRKIQ